MSMMYIEVDGNMVSSDNILQAKKAKVIAATKIEKTEDKKPEIKPETKQAKKKA